MCLTPFAAVAGWRVTSAFHNPSASSQAPEITFLQADVPLLIVVSERKITSEWPTIRELKQRRGVAVAGASVDIAMFDS
jgi:hypothetical protein